MQILCTTGKQHQLNLQHPLKFLNGHIRYILFFLNLTHYRTESIVAIRASFATFSKPANETISSQVCVKKKRDYLKI